MYVKPENIRVLLFLFLKKFSLKSTQVTTNSANNNSQSHQPPQYKTHLKYGPQTNQQSQSYSWYQASHLLVATPYIIVVLLLLLLLLLLRLVAAAATYFHQQELLDLGRDPPSSCSAGPVGDDRKWIYFRCGMDSPSTSSSPLSPCSPDCPGIPAHLTSSRLSHPLSLPRRAVFHWQATM